MGLRARAEGQARLVCHRCCQARGRLVGECQAYASDQYGPWGRLGARNVPQTLSGLGKAPLVLYSPGPQTLYGPWGRPGAGGVRSAAGRSGAAAAARGCTGTAPAKGPHALPGAAARVIREGSNQGHGLTPCKTLLWSRCPGHVRGPAKVPMRAPMTTLPRTRHAFGCALGAGSAAVLVQHACAAWPFGACRLAPTLARVWRGRLARASSASAN